MVKFSYMGKFLLLTSVLCLCTNVFAQADLQSMLATEKAFEQTATEKGNREAFLKYFADDSVIFRPNPVNTKEFWKLYQERTPTLLTRKAIDYDVSSNGMMGYTTGDWRQNVKGKSDDFSTFGQYVTVWEKKSDGRYFAAIDISITHDKMSFAETDRTWPEAKTRDPNNVGWSVADASMVFLRESMAEDGLAGAYKKFAADNVRLLIEREPPVLGKKKVVKEMKRYVSISFPKKVEMLQAADMAYTWNPCEFANSNEGTEKGNCLQIWKFSDKKWEIILGVFARVTNETKPTLQVKQKPRKGH